MLLAVLGGGALFSAGCEPRTGSPPRSEQGGGDQGGGGSNDRPPYNGAQGDVNSQLGGLFTCEDLQAEWTSSDHKRIRISAVVDPMPEGPIVKYKIHSSNDAIEGRRHGGDITANQETGDISTTIDATGVGYGPRATVSVEWPTGVQGNFAAKECGVDGI